MRAFDAAGDDRTLRACRGGAGVATPGDDARVLPVDPALDERVGPARLPIAKRVADVMGRPPEMESEDDVESGEIPSDVRSLAMPAWPAPRPREDDPTAPRAIETAAEVIRVRRVARSRAWCEQTGRVEGDGALDWRELAGDDAAARRADHGSSRPEA